MVFDQLKKNLILIGSSKQFLSQLPDTRNMHTHSTDFLYAGGLRTIEIVRELIAQLFQGQHTRHLYRTLGLSIGIFRE